VSVSHFNEIATEYDEALPAHVVEHYLRKRASFLTALCPAGSVLDVGCGTGALAARLCAAGYRVVGADPSAGMLEVMRRRSPEIEAINAPGGALPFPSGEFDLVVSVATMHHIAAAQEIRRTLSEMVRVCRPQGHVVVWDHNPRNPYWSNLMARVPQDTGDERLIPAREVVSGLHAAGAQVLSIQQLGLVPDFTPRRAVRVAALAERLFERTPYLSGLAAHNVIVARPGRSHTV
jgi:SAM-dependent methyltransferase